MEKPKIERFCDMIEKATLDVTMVICAVMLVVAWMHVTRRYVFNNALTWSEEFLRFSIVWYALLSASLLHKRNGHLGITIFREMMPKPVKSFLRRVIIYLATAVAGIVTVAGFILVRSTWEQITPALGISTALPYAAIPVSFFLMTVYGLMHIVRDIMGLPPIAPDEAKIERIE
ncbi:MAG TPA: TRAP transporter small permease [Deltaproteobacteria bacterium]|jgi:TRAP-type C4-dicarboxylate transport system permease small subunit|nr:TRAP transporter small permease [Deltaproteobacteria bacterium]HQI02355.1 TRAP transporter small permease [Deltaproteobacteria bacterium]